MTGKLYSVELIWSLLGKIKELQEKKIRLRLVQNVEAGWLDR